MGMNSLKGWIETSANEQMVEYFEREWICDGEISNWTNELNIFISNFIAPIESNPWSEWRWKVK